MRKGGAAALVRRVPTAVKGLPRALREDLWSAAVGPPPRPVSGRPGWMIWQPAVVTALVLCAVLLVVFSVSELAFGRYGLGMSYALLLGGLQGAALVAALFRPVAAWWMVTLGVVAVALLAASSVHRDALFPWTGWGIAAQAGVLLLLALRVRPRAAAEALTLSIVAGGLCGLLAPPVHNSSIGRAVVVLTTAVVVGATLRGRQVAHDELVLQEGMTAEERSRRTLLEERQRIARELHDVVAHHMSVISIQAQVAPHLVKRPSDELKENLAGIRDHAVEALTELRRVLGVLRSEDAPAEPARHAPQPTLDRLDELIGKVRDAGLTVHARTAGEPRPVPPGVDLSAFRIVQEALSNVLRHAPGADVEVEIGYHAAALTVRVTNTAPVAGQRGPGGGVGEGHGLLGIRERAAMLGGEVVTGATPDGGYEVTAALPTAPGLPAALPDTAGEDTA
nr:histidine kinase [Streptomyces sp. TRM64462]